MLSQRPALSRLDVLLSKTRTSKVQVLNGLKIAARLDCGTIFSQSVRAAPVFMSKPWYDAVLIDADERSSALLSSRAPHGSMLVGEVRLLFRQAQQDMVVICFWEPVQPVPGCPIEQRNCTRLRWALPPNGDSGHWHVQVIPVSRIRRVVHVVPDFEEIAKKRCLEARPPPHNVSVQAHREMRFYVNAFFPWA